MQTLHTAVISRASPAFNPFSAAPGCSQSAVRRAICTQRAVQFCGSADLTLIRRFGAGIDPEVFTVWVLRFWYLDCGRVTRGVRCRRMRLFF